MPDADLLKPLIAAAAILATVVAALASARPEGRERREEAPAPARPPAPAPTAPGTGIPRAGAKPRILTGEPAPPEPRTSAPLRALRLAGGITAIAVAGALGLVAIVRALVAMFERG